MLCCERSVTNMCEDEEWQILLTVSYAPTVMLCKGISIFQDLTTLWHIFHISLDVDNVLHLP